MTPMASPPCCVATSRKLLADQLKGFFPGGGSQAAVFANQRLGKAVFMVGEIERVTALDAEEVAIDAALVAVVAAHDFHAGIGTAHA